MHKGSIDLNRSLYEGVKSTSSEAIDEIIEECDVEINEDACVIEGGVQVYFEAKNFNCAFLSLSLSLFGLHQFSFCIWPEFGQIYISLTCPNCFCFRNFPI